MFLGEDLEQGRGDLPKDEAASRMEVETGLATPTDTEPECFTSPEIDESGLRTAKARPRSIAMSLRGEASYYVEVCGVFWSNGVQYLILIVWRRMLQIFEMWIRTGMMMRSRFEYSVLRLHVRGRGLKRLRCIQEVMVISKKPKSRHQRRSIVASTTSTTTALDTVMSMTTLKISNTAPSSSSEPNFPSSAETTPTLTPSTSATDQTIFVTRTHRLPLAPSVRRELECYKLLARMSSSSSDSRVQFLQRMHSCWEDESDTVKMVFERMDGRSLVQRVRGLDETMDVLGAERWQMKIWACEIVGFLVPIT